MPSALNQMIKEETKTLFESASNCVLVDFNGLSVETVNALRSLLRQKEIRMQVVKTSLARQVLGESGTTAEDGMLDGPTAVVWGGEDILQVSKAVNDFAKKNKGLRIKGGFLDRQAINSEDVQRLTTIPDVPVLLASIAGLFTAPLRDICGCVQAIVANVAYAIDAVTTKKEESAQG